ncbi:MAG TPA: DUF1775 domain-containing protein [Candidatus Cybelea sp.]
MGHVRVFPDSNNTQTPACSYAKFVVRVPVERNVPTNRIDLAIPKGVVVFAVQPKAGWQFTLQKTRGIITGISWSGGRLMPEEFDEFAFIAATPKTPGPISWDASQYYENGEIVRWTGAPKSDTPHSVTTVVPGKCSTRKKVK